MGFVVGSHLGTNSQKQTANGNEPVGTGLGLYMIKCLMEPYDAEIGVESTIDVGTTFRLKIPRTKKPS